MLAPVQCKVNPRGSPVDSKRTQSEQAASRRRFPTGVRGGENASIHHVGDSNRDRRWRHRLLFGSSGSLIRRREGTLAPIHSPAPGFSFWPGTSGKDRRSQSCVFQNCPEARKTPCGLSALPPKALGPLLVGASEPRLGVRLRVGCLNYQGCLEPTSPIAGLATTADWRRGDHHARLPGLNQQAIRRSRSGAPQPLRILASR